MPKFVTMTDFRIGHGYDVHAIAPGLRMRLCGVDIESDSGFVAHSDGDVAIHALCDALLGALALGDIGHLYPDSSDKFLNIDSRILLRDVYLKIKTLGYQIGNIDVTVLAQVPKLAPYEQKMRENLAEDLQTDLQNISIKATTTEKLGFVGRKEGIAVESVELLEHKD